MSLPISLFIILFIFFVILLFGIKFIVWVFKSIGKLFRYNTYEEKHKRMGKRIAKADRKRKEKFPNSNKYKW